MLSASENSCLWTIRKNFQTISLKWPLCHVWSFFRNSSWNCECQAFSFYLISFLMFSGLLPSFYILSNFFRSVLYFTNSVLCCNCQLFNLHTDFINIDNASIINKRWKYENTNFIHLQQGSIDSLNLNHLLTTSNLLKSFFPYLYRNVLRTSISCSKETLIWDSPVHSSMAILFY